MKILLTGGAGYIGSVTTAKLVEAGHDVTVVDSLALGHRDAIAPGAKFIQANIAELDNVISAEDGFEAVLHFAAFMAAGESMQVPEKYWENNTIGTLKLLETLHKAGIKKLIFSSTAAVYGNQSEEPITEETPTIPTNTYGMTKLAIDMAITSYCLAHGFAATSLRYFNVAGAYGNYGERHPEETHIIPLALQAATGERESFTIFGEDYPTPDGTCIRDYIHVSDLADAHLLALEKLEQGKHTIYNLGNGNGFSNKEVIKAVEEVTGKTLPVTVGSRRKGDPAKLIASSEKAKTKLGWTPKKPAINDIVADAWTFYQAQKTK
jgi:UDP-glucose 4-epimerase